MFRALLLSSALLLAAAPALGQQGCPVASDLASGIRIAFTDGRTEVFQSAGPGVVAADGIMDGQVAYRMLLGHGTHILRYEEPGNPAATQDYDYGLPPEEMPVPAPGGRWQVSVTVTAADGDRIEAQAQAYDSEHSVTIGACTYRAIPTLISYDTADAYLEYIEFLPELGFGYLAWAQSLEGRGDERVPQSISAGK